MLRGAPYPNQHTARGIARKPLSNWRHTWARQLKHILVNLGSFSEPDLDVVDEAVNR